MWKHEDVFQKHPKLIFFVAAMIESVNTEYDMHKYI